MKGEGGRGREEEEDGDFGPVKANAAVTKEIKKLAHYATVVDKIAIQNIKAPAKASEEVSKVAN
eukprot:457259-Pyramimonas_sp.AAC.1